MARLSSALPKDAEKNGLYAIERDLLEDPLRRHLVLAVVDCSKITTDTTTKAREATVRVLRIEQVHPDDAGEAERLVRRALEWRSGETVLPIDLEKDLDSWFGAGVTVDTTTGLVTVPSDGLPGGDVDAVDIDSLVLDEDEPLEGGDDDDDDTDA